jgi:hypothetical protein
MKNVVYFDEREIFLFMFYRICFQKYFGYISLRTLANNPKQLAGQAAQPTLRQWWIKLSRIFQSILELERTIYFFKERIISPWCEQNKSILFFYYRQTQQSLQR